MTDSSNHVPCFKICYVMMLGTFSNYLCLTELCLLAFHLCYILQVSNLLYRQLSVTFTG